MDRVRWSVERTVPAHEERPPTTQMIASESDGPPSIVELSHHVVHKSRSS